MSRTGFRNVRSQQKSQRQFHRRWDDSKGKNLNNENMTEQRPKRTLAEYEALGALIKKDPLRYSILYQLEYLNRWTPTALKPN